MRGRVGEGGGESGAGRAGKEEKDRKGYAAKGGDGKEMQLVIRFAGEFVGARAGEVGDFMSMVQTATGVQLMPVPAEALKEAGQWIMLQDPRSGWRGDVLVKTGSQAEAIRMYSSLEGKAITIPGGGRMVIEAILHIALVDAARQAKSGRII